VNHDKGNRWEVPFVVAIVLPLAEMVAAVWVAGAQHANSSKKSDAENAVKEIEGVAKNDKSRFNGVSPPKVGQLGQYCSEVRTALR
jgi:hypothetical protein